MILSILTVSSTAVIATITASPLSLPGPQDTPIFSVPNLPFSSSSSSATITPAIRPVDIPTVTIMVTATVTANNGSPYPAFDASNYPHHNFTCHPERKFTNHHHHHDEQQQQGINCTNTQAVTYRNRTETFIGVVYTTNKQSKCVNVVGTNATNGTDYGHRTDTAVAEHEREHAKCLDFCCHHRYDGKNETMMHGHRNETVHGHNDKTRHEHTNATTMYEHAECMLACHHHHEHNNETLMHEQNKNSTAHAEATSANQPKKRTEDKNLNDEVIPAYLKALEKGPVVRSVTDRVVSAFRGIVGS